MRSLPRISMRGACSTFSKGILCRHEPCLGGPLTPSRCFLRRQRPDRESVDAIGELTLDSGMYHSLPFDARLARKRRRNDLDPEMAFSEGLRAGMARVKLRL